MAVTKRMLYECQEKAEGARNELVKMAKEERRLTAEAAFDIIARDLQPLIEKLSYLQEVAPSE